MNEEKQTTEEVLDEQTAAYERHKAVVGLREKLIKLINEARQEEVLPPDYIISELELMKLKLAGWYMHHALEHEEGDE